MDGFRIDSLISCVDEQLTLMLELESIRMISSIHLHPGIILERDEARSDRSGSIALNTFDSTSSFRFCGLIQNHDLTLVIAVRSTKRLQFQFHDPLVVMDMLVLSSNCMGWCHAATEMWIVHE